MIRYRSRWVATCQIVMGLLIVFPGCHTDSVPGQGLLAYYYPVEQLPRQGVTYIYRSKLDSLAAPEVWTFRQDGAGKLVSVNYDQEGHEVLYQYDHIVPNGVITDSLFMGYIDDRQQEQRVRVKVIEGNRFPAMAPDSSKAFMTHFEWYQPKDSLHVELQRKRNFLGHTTWIKDGVRHPAIRFKTEDLFETEIEGWTSSVWKGEEWYAEGIGLVYYRRQITDGLVLEFELAERK